MDCCCCGYNESEAPDTAPCPEELDVQEIVRGLDELVHAGRKAEASEYLKQWLAKAREVGDWRAELSVLSELLGLCRSTGECELALDCVKAARSLISDHGMSDTVSGATVLLNAATTLKCFGRASESIPLFQHVARVFSSKLDPGDYRMAGLYNNMALSYVDLKIYDAAETHFKLALSIVSKTESPENDVAVTYCNLAELYAAQDGEDKRIEECVDKAYEALSSPTLPHDGYHAYTISKCLPCFDKFGFFLYSKELRERMEAIYAGA